MVRGRKPTPSHVLTLRGNPGKRPLNRREPKPKGGLPPCPERLKGAARQAWESFGQQLTECGAATSLDATALELLCESYAALAEASAQVAKHGPVWIERQPGKLPKFCYSPFWVVQNREHKKLMALLTEFGMTPSSRTRVHAVSNPEAEELERFLAGG